MLNIDKTTANQDLFSDLNEENAEIISGGYEGFLFSIKNATNYNAGLSIDGVPFINRPGEEWIWTVYSEGTISFSFDTDGRDGYEQWQECDLSDGGVYEFRYNTYTVDNPYDIELYSV